VSFSIFLGFGRLSFASFLLSVEMECMRAMSSSSSVVCSVLPSLAIGRSGVGTSPARLQVAVSLPLSPLSLSLRSGTSSKRADFPKWQTRASSSSSADEVDEVASEAGRGVEEAKDKSKQSFSNKVEDMKTVVGKAQSHAGETANKVGVAPFAWNVYEASESCVGEALANRNNYH